MKFNGDLTDPRLLNVIVAPPGVFVLDIGGEGRHPGAWNLNPRTSRSTRGAQGRSIPRLIVGRGEAIPLADNSVDVVIVERTPLRRSTLREIFRVTKPAAKVILRHAIGPLGDPHRVALEVLRGHVARRTFRLGMVQVRETTLSLERD